MGRHGDEDGNARRTRLAFERLRDHVRSLPPGEIERANTLVMRNELWAHKYAWEFIAENRRRLAGIPHVDVHQAAFLGSVKASYTWNPSRDGAFTYWAWFWMRKEMHRLLTESGPVLYFLFEDDRGNVDLESPHASAGEAAEAADYVAKVRAEVGRLPEVYRLVLDDWAEGVPLDATAARIGRSGRYVMRIKAAALGWLRYRMGEGPEPEGGMIGIGRGHGHEHEPSVHVPAMGGQSHGG